MSRTGAWPNRIPAAPPATGRRRMPAVDRDFGLTDEQRQIVGAVRDYVAERVAPAVSGYEERGEFPRDLFAGLGSMGLAGIPFDEHLGGGGQPYLTYAAVLEEIATGSLTLAEALSVHHLSASGVAWYGSDELKARYLPRLLSGEWLGAYALSEASSGSDAASLDDPGREERRRRRVRHRWNEAVHQSSGRSGVLPGHGQDRGRGPEGDQRSPWRGAGRGSGPAGSNPRWDGAHRQCASCSSTGAASRPRT